ncbi:MAG: hypothetical protein R3F34_15835 [Planctomycetota bacterium]
MSGDTIVVGATGGDSNATGVGGSQTDDSAGNSVPPTSSTSACGR